MAGFGTDVVRAAGGIPTIELDREAVLQPAFRDPHVHLLGMAAASLSVDCRAEHAPSVPDALDLLRASATRRAEGTWIRAFGFDEALVRERRAPTAAELDSAVPAHPLALRHRTGHAVILNSCAARALAGAQLSPGELLDPIDIPDRLPGFTRSDLTSAVARESTALAAAGVVAVADATADNDLSRLEALCRMKMQNTIHQDLVFMPGALHTCDLAAAGLSFGAEVDGVQIGHAKVLSGHGTRPIADQVAEARDSGWPVAIHVLDPSEIDEALRALAAVDRIPGIPDRLEHVGLCLPDQVDAIVASGAAVVTNPGFLLHRGEKYEHELTPLEREWLYPVRSLVRRGVCVAGASDAPVIPSRPLEAVQAAVRRGGAARFARKEMVPLQTAFGLVTAAAARVMGGRRGGLQQGDRADFVVLGQDPRAVDPAQLSTVPIVATFKGGIPLFAEPGFAEQLQVRRSSRCFGSSLTYSVEVG